MVWVAAIFCLSFHGQCSVTCGEGRETRYVACMSLEELEEQKRGQSECDVAIKPPTERICNRRDCLQDKQLSIIAISSNSVVGTTFWRAGPWGPVCVALSLSIPCLCIPTCPPIHPFAHSLNLLLNHLGIHPPAC